MLLFDLIDALERREAADGRDPISPSVGGPLFPPASPPFLTPPIVPWPHEPRPPVFTPTVQQPVAAKKPLAGLIDLLLQDNSEQMPELGAGMEPRPHRPVLPESPSWSGTGEEVRALPKGEKIGGIADTLQNHIRTGVLARASLAPDIATQIKRLSEMTGIPERSFGIINGRIVYGDATGQIHYAVPSFAGADSSQGFLGYLFDLAQRGSRYLASKAGPAIPTTAGAAVGGALMEVPALSIPAAGAAAASGDLARQWLDKYLAGEPLMTTDYNWRNAGSYAPQAMGGQGVALGAKSLLQLAPVLPSFVGSTAIGAARKSVNPSFDREREQQLLLDYARRASAGGGR